uniref:DUF6266 family protein n=1 Tax=Pedobacter schmidteae TaxID=2201271 RepID=UPI000EAE5BAE|nr:DUF6266 family protein [Pedobacter schmidteae]
MAKLPKGIFGPVSGKIGSVVGATWNGQPYLRQAPRPQKRTKLIKSAARLANEAKFKLVSTWLVPFHPFVDVGFKNVPEGKTALGAAFSVIYHQAITGTYPVFAVDYAKVVISAGDLPGLNQPVMNLIAADTIEIKWQQNKLRTASFDDQLMLALYCPELEIIDGFIGGVRRADLQTTFHLNPLMAGKAIEVYLSVTSLNRKKIADSIYLGRLEP